MENITFIIFCAIGACGILTLANVAHSWGGRYQ